MKIGIDARVARWHIGSGLGNYTSQIIEHLNNIDHENEYLLFLKNEWFRQLGNREEERKKNFWPLMYETHWRIQPDVDIFHNTTNGIGIPDKGNHKLVITLHDLIPYIMPETVDKLHREYVLKHTPEIIENAHKIITVSYHSKKDIQKYFNVSQEKISVIYHAANKIFKPLDKKWAKEMIAKKYGMNYKFILYLGGFSPRKNITRLIRAFHMICNEFEETYKLVILGEPSRTYESLNRLAEKLCIADKVIFTGFVPTSSLPLFYNSCEAFVYPSLYEGFGLPPLEAAACRIPIITSNISSIPEIMGNSCTYIDPYDVVDMAQGIYDTLINDHLREDLSDKAFEHSRKYSWRKASEETLKVYRSLIK